MPFFYISLISYMEPALEKPGRHKVGNRKTPGDIREALGKHQGDTTKTTGRPQGNTRGTPGRHWRLRHWRDKRQ